MRSATTEPLPVLVVDDDSALIRTLADILRMHGYAPATAGTGMEGLALAAHTSPALAVVDLRLPDMDGMELAAKLHELSALTEVVVLTGNASLESAVAALREHSVDYLLKPVDVEHLLHVASVATERWQRRQAEGTLIVRARQQAAVAQLGQRALLTPNVPDLLNESVILVAATLDVPLSSVLERRSDGKALVFRASAGWTGIQHGQTQVPIRDDTQAGFTALHNDPVIISELAKDTRFTGSTRLREYDIVSGITVPIPGPVHPFGVLEAHDHKRRAFSQDDAHFLQAIAHVIGTAIDRNRTESAFRQAQRMEAVGRLASGVSHDFNNMLTAITGYAEMLRAGLPENDPLRDDANEILKAADRAAALTRQLLAFSRQQVLQPRVVMLNEIVGGIERMLQRLIGANVNLVASLDSDLGLVMADPGQVEQVILNLCVNARDAMPEGGTLTIETANAELDVSNSPDQTVDEPGSYVMLAVTDTGSGMDNEVKARIFEPFFTTKPQEQGTGLGLATVYGIVKQSGGEIWVYSEIGRGTTFKIFLPRFHGASAEHPVPVARTAGARGTETILLAEDEESIRGVARRILEKAGYRVLVAGNGEEASRVAEQHPGEIQLLVTDMMMPLLDGQRLAERLRALRPGLKVLFLSGYTDAFGNKGMSMPDAHFLPKPFSGDTLTRKVREALDAESSPQS
jgi:two-component system, cell cycle sensor histidine kinase and response regulator CckA